MKGRCRRERGQDREATCCPDAVRVRALMPAPGLTSSSAWASESCTAAHMPHHHMQGVAHDMVSLASQLSFSSRCSMAYQPCLRLRGSADHPVVRSNGSSAGAYDCLWSKHLAVPGSCATQAATLCRKACSVHR